MMIAGREMDIAMTGIRPGEKIHEILVSAEEAFRTTERAGHYVLLPQLPEFHVGDVPRPLSDEYSSAHGVVTGDALAQLIAQSGFVDSAMMGPMAESSASRHP
jgi:UDP-glucose 4-epimerase